jgi:hypothetical protein
MRAEKTYILVLGNLSSLSLSKKCCQGNLVTRQSLWQKEFMIHNNARGVSHYGLAIYIKKYLKAKEELWKLKYFTMQKYINLH